MSCVLQKRTRYVSARLAASFSHTAAVQGEHKWPYLQQPRPPAPLTGDHAHSARCAGDQVPHAVALLLQLSLTLLQAEGCQEAQQAVPRWAVGGSTIEQDAGAVELPCRRSETLLVDDLPSNSLKTTMRAAPGQA